MYVCMYVLIINALQLNELSALRNTFYPEYKYVCMYVCKELCLCCFLTVSGQIISAILSSFDGLVFHLLIRGQEKTRLFYAARRKSSKNLICMYDRRSLVFERRQARPVARVWRYSLASCLPPLSLRTREKILH